MSRNIKAVESDIGEVEAKVSGLQVELGELKVKLDQFQVVEDTGDLSVDELAASAQEHRSAAKALGDQVDSIEAAIQALQHRRQRLQGELHELTGVKVVKEYRQRLRRLYTLCQRNNEIIDELIQVRAAIGELEKSIRVPGEYHETKAYIDAISEGWVVPTLQIGAFGENIGELRSTSHLGIGLPKKASEVNQ